MKVIQLISARLVLRNFNMDDLESVHNLLTEPKSNIYNVSDAPKNKTVTKSMIAAWQNENIEEPRLRYTFYIETIDKQFIGLISIGIIKIKYQNADVWYKLCPGFWGKGYATEALNTIIKFGFEDLKLHRIGAGCATANIASYKVLEKAGMLREAHTRKLLPLKSGWSDNYEYAILEEDYFKSILILPN